jgi:hypothetical protein
MLGQGQLSRRICVMVRFQARTKSVKIQPSRAKKQQRKSKKKAWISFDSLWRIRPFQWVAATPQVKKIFPCSFSLSAFAAARKLSLRKIKVARFLIFVKEIRLAFVMVGFSRSARSRGAGQSAAALA